MRFFPLDERNETRRDDETMMNGGWERRWKTKIIGGREWGGRWTIYRKKRMVGWGLHIAIVFGRLCCLEEIRGSTGRPSTGVEAATAAEAVAVVVAMHSGRASFSYLGAINFNERTLFV